MRLYVIKNGLGEGQGEAFQWVTYIQKHSLL